MNRSIFSYSFKDNSLVMRIYDDLQRSGGKPWRYEKNNEDSGDIEYSFKNWLQESDYFILVDSINARASELVAKECEWAQEMLDDDKFPLKKIIVCITDEDGNWRKENKILDRIDKYHFIDFSGYDIFDQFGKYKQCIEKLCQFIDLEYNPWTDEPRATDFEKELFNFANGEIDLADREFLIRDYSNFVSAVRLNSSQSLQRIKWILEHCEKLQIQIISVWLALGVLEVSHGDYKSSKTTFDKAKEHFPDEPRIWAGLAGSHFYLENYEEALQGYNKTLELIEFHQDLHQHQDRYSDIIHNKIEALLELDRAAEAETTLEEVKADIRELPEIKVAEIKILLYQKRFQEVTRLYSDIQYLLVNKHLNDTWLNKLLASLQRELACLVYEHNNREEAEYHLQLAVELDPENEIYKEDLRKVRDGV